jgi:hypothetical protein
MQNETGNGAGDPGHGHRVVLAERLVEEIAEKRGHSKAAAAWAVHRLVERGLLRPEVACSILPNVIGYTQKPGPLLFGARQTREVPDFGPAKRVPLADTTAGPVPYRHLLVYSTGGLWDWQSASAGGVGAPAPEPERAGKAMAPYTLGRLLLELEGSEMAYQDNLRTVERIERRDGSIAAHGIRNSAEAMRWQPDSARMPGIGRIEALCDEEWGTGLKSENVRRLRGRVCSKLGVGIEEANAMTLDSVTTTLGLAANDGASPSPSPPAEDLPEYNAEEQPWWTPLTDTRDLPSGDLVSLAGEIDLVIITATDPEVEAVLRRLEPYPRRRAVLKGFVEQETYYLGKFGVCLAAVTKCRMGSLDSGGATLATQQAPAGRRASGRPPWPHPPGQHDPAQPLRERAALAVLPPGRLEMRTPRRPATVGREAGGRPGVQGGAVSQVSPCHRR